MTAWDILLPAFVMTGLMIATHTYFGLHVLARGIVFVDLALAQIAGLGMSLAFLLGYESHGLEAQLFAFVATLLAALGFTGLHKIKDKTSREVTIGCVYVVATALSLLVLSNTAQGMDELKSLFNGNILWVQWNEIFWVMIAYVLLMLLHVVRRNRFMALSFETDQVSRPSIVWEFVFFASFAIVITLAVNIAGILLVFALLILPGFSASLLAEKFGSRLLLGWLFGLVAGVLGLWLSLVADLPTGAIMVAVLGCLPIVAFVTKKFK